MTNTIAHDRSKPNTSLLIRGALWIAVGALIAAALVCVVWVLIGDQQGLIGRAFLTILLLAGFAGIAILEAGLAPNREDWLSLLSMISWIIALLVGAVKIWLPDDDSMAAARFVQLVGVVVVLQLALLHVRLFHRATLRHVTTLTRIIAYATFAFLGLLAALLVFFLTFPNTFRYDELYWRIVVALTILAAVGTMLIPLLNALFAPKQPRPATVAPYPAPAPQPAPVPLPQPAALAQSAPDAAATGVLPWPTYADARTPLPMLPDGNPDWNAYYTGVPAPGATTFPIPDAAGTPAQPASPEPPSQAARPESTSQPAGLPSVAAPSASTDPSAASESVLPDWLAGEFAPAQGGPESAPAAEHVLPTRPGAHAASEASDPGHAASARQAQDAPAAQDTRPAQDASAAPAPQAFPPAPPAPPRP